MAATGAGSGLPLPAWSPEIVDELRGQLLASSRTLPPALPPVQSAAELLRPFSDDGEQPHAAEVPRRFAQGLKGGVVPRLSCREPHEAVKADELLRAGLPCVLTGGAVIASSSCAGSWSACSLLRRLQGASAVGVVAPPAANGRFMHYSADSHVGDYDFGHFHRPHDSDDGPAVSAVTRQVEVDATLVAAHDEDQSVVSVPQLPYLQLRVRRRSTLVSPPPHANRL